MNTHGTIIGPEGTETIVSTHEAIAAGYSFVWKSKEELIVSKNGKDYQLKCATVLQFYEMKCVLRSLKKFR